MDALIILWSFEVDGSGAVNMDGIVVYYGLFFCLTC